mgnify:CR=1 FL=1
MKTDTFRDYFLEQLNELDGFSWRPMFSGTGLYLEGTFFGIISDGAVYFRVDDETRTQYEVAGARHFQPSKDFESKKYFEVPAEVLDNSREIQHWARQAAQAKRTAEAR